MPVCDLFMRADLVPTLCYWYGKNLRALCRLMSINHSIRNFLKSPAGADLWGRVAEDLLGGDVWGYVNPMLANVDDAAYMAMIQTCPWVSKPQFIPIRFVGNGGSLVDPLRDDEPSVHLNGMRWWIHASLPEQMEDQIVVQARVDGHQRTFTLPLRVEQVATFVQTEMDRDPTQDVDYNIDELVFGANAKLEKSLKTKRLLCRTGRAEFADYSESVNMAKQDLFLNDQGSLVFIKKDDNTCLRRIGCHANVTSTVLTRPGEIWVVHPLGSSIVYYGPRQDRAIEMPTSGRLWSAYVCAERGEAKAALKALKGVDVNSVLFDNGENLLMVAVRGDVRVNAGIVPLLDAGIDINASDRRGMTSIVLAGTMGRRDIVELLLDRGADRCEGLLQTLIGFTLADETRWSWRLSITRVLDRFPELVNDPDPIDDSRTPLMVAGVHYDAWAVRTLLSRGADPLLFDGHGRTALELMRLRMGDRVPYEARAVLVELETAVKLARERKRESRK